MQWVAIENPHAIIIDDQLDDMDAPGILDRMRSHMRGDELPLVLVMPYRAEQTPTSDDEELPKMVQSVCHMLGMPAHSAQATRVDCNGLTMDKFRHQAQVDGRELGLTLTEFRILWMLASQPGYPLSRKELTEACLADGETIQERTIDVHIRSIRQKLKERASLIETVRGIGYRFQDLPSAGHSRQVPGHSIPEHARAEPSTLASLPLSSQATRR